MQISKLNGPPDSVRIVWLKGRPVPSGQGGHGPRILPEPPRGRRQRFAQQADGGEEAVGRPVLDAVPGLLAGVGPRAAGRQVQEMGPPPDDVQRAVKTGPPVAAPAPARRRWRGVLPGQALTVRHDTFPAFPPQPPPAARSVPFYEGCGPQQLPLARQASPLGGRLAAAGGRIGFTCVRDRRSASGCPPVARHGRTRTPTGWYHGCFVRTASGRGPGLPRRKRLDPAQPRRLEPVEEVASADAADPGGTVLAPRGQFDDRREVVPENGAGGRGGIKVEG